ncbi:MAG TPA: hypothetical protein VFM06_07385 [Candidatus Limnocylindria bacterium]|nr:hypothetical protein [Candidatus Limnocylindria bacterium]
MPEIVRVELNCLYCGHSCGEAQIGAPSRHAYAAVRAAFDATITTSAPVWDAHGIPRCPRCGGALFIEALGRRHLATAR